MGYYEPVLDDDGLRRLLKLQEDADLKYYRDRAGLPYSSFKRDNRTFYRYLEAEVLGWLKKRQHNGIENSEGMS